MTNFLKVIIKILNNIKGVGNNLFYYRKIVFYLFRKGGIRRVYNFLWTKSFVFAGGEGTACWVGSFFIPLFSLTIYYYFILNG